MLANICFAIERERERESEKGRESVLYFGNWLSDKAGPLFYVIVCLLLLSET